MTRLTLLKIAVKILALSSLLKVFAEEFKLSGLFFGCERDVTLDYHKGLQDFSTRLYKAVALRKMDHFAISQYSIWLSLAALAEGSTTDVQNRIFKALNLPDDTCLREKYYEIATSLESPGNDVTFKRTRIIVIDDRLKLNQTWAREARASGLVETKIEMLKNITSTNQIKELIDANITEHTIAGNSMIIDLLDYNGLWTTTFENSSIERSDFYNDEGIKIGKVDLMRMKKRVKLAYIPLLNAKLLELPVGNNGRYRMLFILNLGKNHIRHTIEHFPSSLIVDSMPLLIESLIPLEVAIPKFRMTSDMDLRESIVDVGVGDIWSKGAARSILWGVSGEVGEVSSRIAYNCHYEIRDETFLTSPLTLRKIDLSTYSPFNGRMEPHWLLTSDVVHYSYISDPAAPPAAIIHQVTVTIDTPGLEYIQTGYGLTGLASELATGIASAAGREFTANRPFIFGLVDSQTRTWLFSGAFSKP